MSFTVKVVNDDGDPVRGVDVMLSFTDLTRGTTNHEQTDSDGRAEFSGHKDGEVKVFVDHSNQGEYLYEDGEEITITA
jgi:uncharacterized GH25 family protein